MMVYGKLLYTVGSILIAAAATVRSFNFMIVGRIIAALGHISTEIAGFKMFSSWFPPSQGFASTLGFEGAASALGGFVGKATANVIAESRGFGWSFWVAVFVNIFGNIATIIFWLLNRYRLRHYQDPEDSATGENLQKARFKFQKIFQLPWMFWSVMGISLWISSLATVFSQNATELAEKRFNVDTVTAGWYSAASQYGGLVIMPFLGMFLDVCGNRATVLLISASSLLVSMLLLNFAVSIPGTIVTFVIYALVKAIAPTAVVDSFRTTLWEESIFGSALSLKETMNATVNIIVRMITGAIQDADNDSYVGVVKVYLVMAFCAMAFGMSIFLGALVSPSLAPLQWTRRQRLSKGPGHLALLRENHLVLHIGRTRWTTIVCCGVLGILTLASWAIYIWGAITGNSV
ncbi:major facilitator superfamily domain-containing protein [Aspergillus ambiguus]|uniref:major facilitator superfamily domain-containing protein n=1 Tax=Aspergillus ambiguus TaxID=176160 RepID=UPI003CCE523A